MFAGVYLSFWIQQRQPVSECLPIHLPDQQMIMFNLNPAQEALAKNRSTKYFKMNKEDPLAKDDLCCDIPQHYTWCNNSKSYRRRVRVTIFQKLLVVCMQYIHCKGSYVILDQGWATPGMQASLSSTRGFGNHNNEFFLSFDWHAERLHVWDLTNFGMQVDKGCSPIFNIKQEQALKI